MARVFLLAGESSGDRLGAVLAQELISRGHEVHGWGGSQMHEQGVELHQDIRELNVMGFSDVLMRAPQLIRLLTKCKNDIEDNQPDILILIDFGTFNLRVAKWAKGKIEKVVYYSPPKLWASRPGRIKNLKKFSDQIIVLFPFEQAYYQQEKLEVQYFGHPLFEAATSKQIDQEIRMNFQLDSRPILSILPGSRVQEVKRLLPIYLESVQDLGNYNICVSATPLTSQIIHKMIPNGKGVTIIEGFLHELLSQSRSAIVTSGTATLEAALFEVPQVVCYKTSWLNYWIAKAMIRVPYISLINLISGEKIVEELIQDDCTPENIRSNILRLEEDNVKSNIASYYQDIVNQLSLPDITKRTVAAIIG